MKQSGNIIRFTILLLTVFYLTSGYSADWPRWRGLHGDGISAEIQWNPQAIKAGGKELFRVQLGDGWSAVSVQGDRLYTMGNVEGQDIVYCLHSKTGKEVWRYAYDCGAGNYPGPRSTPVIDEDLVYTISREGHLFCFNAANGKIVWKHQLVDELQAGIPTWGIAGSAVIDNNLVLINAGMTGMAFDKKTGKKVWGTGGIGGYSAPVVFTYLGQKRAAIFGEVKLHVVEVATGKMISSYDWVTSYHVNAADPIVINDKLFISSGYGRGCALLRMTGNGLQVVWENKELNNQFSSSIYLNGYFYGVDGNAGRGNLKCLDAKTGDVKWAENLGFGALMSAKDLLIVLNEKGTLTIAQADPSGYQNVSTAEGLLKQKCWTAPVLSHGILYLRNSGGELLALDVRK